MVGNYSLTLVKPMFPIELNQNRFASLEKDSNLKLLNCLKVVVPLVWDMGVRVRVCEFESQQ